MDSVNPLNAELNPTCHLLALLGAHHILHVSRIRVKTRIITHRNDLVCGKCYEISEVNVSYNVTVLLYFILTL
jgi:hypothetical protein